MNKKLKIKFRLYTSNRKQILKLKSTSLTQDFKAYKIDSFQDPQRCYKTAEIFVKLGCETCTVLIANRGLRPCHLSDISSICPYKVT